MTQVQLLEKNVLHYPTMKTVLLVEKTLKEADTAITRAELKRRLPVKIMHQTLNLIIAYLVESNKVFDGKKGLLWIFNPNPKLTKAIEKGAEV